MTAPTAPIAWMVYTLDGKSAFVTDNPTDFGPEHKALPLYATPPQRKPLTDETIGEVVIQDTLHHGYAMAIKPHIQGVLPKGTKLYATPPQRKPLTDDEICKLWDSHTIEVFGKIGINPVVFARYLERAHGIGERE